MPCGSRDKRRAGHRCLRCRQDHLKCDGRRPCSACVSRGSACSSPPTSSREITFVQYGSKPVVHKPVVQDSWRFINVFFSAVGVSTTPLSSVFSYDNVGTVFQENELVHKTVSIVGSVYASRTATILDLSPQEKREARLKWNKHREFILSQMHSPTSTPPRELLLCALLITVAELMISEEGENWTNMLRTISNYLQQNLALVWGGSAFGSSLLRFFRMSDILRSICYSVDMTLPPFFSTLQPHSPTIRLQPGSEDRWDILVDKLEQWARLQMRLNRLVEAIEQGGYSDVSLADSNGHFQQEGIEIICLASQLQRDFISAILSYTPSDGHVTDPATKSLLAYYHWGLTGLSWKFLEPVWQLLDCPLPKMEDEMVRKQATTALEYAESSLSGVQLDAVLWAAIPVYVGLVVTGEGRMQMLGFLRTLKAKGFAIAATFETGLQECWAKFSDPRFDDLAEFAAAAAANRLEQIAKAQQQQAELGPRSGVSVLQEEVV
ncbi:uncharacterized protein K452DRAFT_115324 [Aplosporella prunicola CBS 121167]|uniref:Zn(2)-C6 fungal-type domain-containing protein n=1 Tax=Aplosporella prunicola CBS 121167 TaxID=1176127 RepID=A0A6A6B1D2_9PEZI|nr:uncharacterized protein K452DRAFT_115324 [Aplosporella prunicola CBS 121167]KAF2137034.1 hypothetical protein K452DRAFT_115324 [Aplosporella prunicola CBS 121167]